jgi:hypothetical protein
MHEIATERPALDAFRRRSWFQRIAEGGANFFTRLL